ncbi:MAG: leucine-rich repeat protein [Eubacterium sp.]|nr:leucine-rich repeat protein [Eubacterium sp.]
MKRRFNKLLAVILSAAMCIPALPAETVNAANDPGVIFLEPESVGISELGSDRSTLFNDDWKFILDDPVGAEGVNYSDTQWENLNLPHDYSIIQEFTTSCDDESGYLPGGTGWYRKKFTLPVSCANKSIVLDFDGVYKDAYVYVNGTLLGENHYGYNSFALDISDAVTCDGSTENVIAVKVEHQTPSSRWYSGSGIYRDVNLVITDKVHVNLGGTAVTTPNLAESNGTDGTVNIKADIVNDMDQSAEVTVINEVYDADNRKVASSAGTTVTVNANSSQNVEDTVKVEEADVKLWNIWSNGDQDMYRVHTKLSVNGSVVDEYDSVLGFRWFEFNDEVGFKLNGENVKLNGVCMHHDQGALGSAAYYDAVYRQLSIMKDMGVNAVRITHNPSNKQYLEICNELGLLAIEEFFDGWEWSKNGNRYDFASYFGKNIAEDNQLLGADASMTWAEYVMKSVIKRDRNNPSLIMWSLGNEIDEGAYHGDDPKWAVIAQNLIDWMKEEDTAHPATSGDNKRDGAAYTRQVNEIIDQSGGVVGFNYPRSDDQIHNLGENYNAVYASETASHINSRGIYMSQASGTDADGKRHLTSYDTSAVGWGQTAHDSMWRTMYSDRVAGQFVWTGFDYIGEPTPWNSTGPGGNLVDGQKQPLPNSSYFGIVETSGFEKDNYYLYRSQWNQTDTTLHLVTAWDPDNMINSNGKTPVVVYSNAPVVKLYRGDDLVGTATRKALSETTTPAGHVYYAYSTKAENASLCSTSSGSGADSLYASFDVAYADGTISAKAFEADGTTEITNTVGKAAVSTPGTASKLKASVDKTEIAADGSSLAYITVDVTDANDVLDTTAVNEITVSLSGNGEIAGVDNGDQASLKKFQQPSAVLSSTSAKIDAYAGKALVIVRSVKEGGKITVNLTADNLTAAAAEITAVGQQVSENEIASYRMVKHFYAPVKTKNIELPTAVEATYTDGTKKNYTVAWKTYDKTKLEKAGNIRIDGSFQADGKEINVYITGHIYDKIAAAKNYSAMTRPGIMPTLPSVAMTYYADGTEFETFPVQWKLDGITGETFREIGTVVSIQGTVTALGSTCPVTASIRVAEPVVDKHTNVAGTAALVTENQRYSDELSAVNDGVKEDNGPSSRWTTYNQMGTNEEAVITMAWDTPTTSDLVDVYYFYQPSNENSQLPTSVRFEYALSCTIENGTIISDNWQEISFDPEKVQPIDGATSMTTGYSYALDSTVAFQAFRIALGRDTDKFIGLNEIEILKPTESYYSNTSADLDSVTVGGVKVDFTGDTTEYVVDAASLADIKVGNALNAAVTIIKVSDSEAKLVAVSEDGKTTKTYTLKLKNKPSGGKDDEDLPNPNKDQLKKDQTATVAGNTYKVLDPVKKTVALTAGNKKLAGKLTIDKVKIGTVSCTVVSIADNAFKKADKLSGVTIGSSVTSIGKNAFANCKKLKSVVIGKSVKTIGKNAFNGCKILKTVTFKGTAVKSIGSKAFKGTAKKITVKVPKKLKKNKKFKQKLTKAGMSKKLKVK